MDAMPKHAFSGAKLVCDEMMGQDCRDGGDCIHFWRFRSTRWARSHERRLRLPLVDNSTRPAFPELVPRAYPRLNRLQKSALAAAAESATTATIPDDVSMMRLKMQHRGFVRTCKR
ncbi:hypothetical protein BDBG_03440 [Blastomyces gilchristii SLH14081]|uniref:Uncharacterized protein n=1 Tax=Blastomyces gilchristii (strain SLH14081) TaxID=559298 RepID=A0A179UHN6_BLAGS|nr:uncharacterized protein BDBG_03440 [Blastomyces gilchristii SLH14081]OAT07370.1 hypothetical protein BDBG_03440 [Blastomyces gilchristii SLH14081]